MKPRFSLTSRIENAINPEDLVCLPDTNWVIATSMSDVSGRAGCLYVVDAVDRECRTLFSAPAFARAASIATAKRDTPIGPEVHARGFTPHGLALRKGKAQTHTLYVVNHYPFDCVEVFEVRANRSEVSASWVESLRLPPGTSGNDVVTLPDGGLALTNMLDPGDPDSAAKMDSGAPTGNVLEWRPGEGWTNVPGSELSGPNGIEVSPDGKWYFVSSWSGNKLLMRISRGRQPVEKTSVRTGFLNDNLSWSSDGNLMVTGQYAQAKAFSVEFISRAHLATPFGVLKVNPDTMEIVETLITHDGRDGFGAGTVAIEVGEELWVGSSRSSTIACFGEKA